MSNKVQIASAACGPAFAVLFTIGWWFIAGFVPPHAPLMSAAEVATAYSENTGGIRFGMLLAMFSASLTIPFAAVIAVQLRRIEGRSSVLAYTELAAGAVAVWILIIPAILWTAAAFRPDRDPQIILLLNDVGWLFLLMTFAPLLVQLVSIGIGVLSDPRESPLFARWVGYFNIWVAILFIPGGMITFFKTGPFAWDGLIAFWIPLGVFVAWFIVMFFVLVKAIRTPITDD